MRHLLYPRVLAPRWARMPRLEYRPCTYVRIYAPQKTPADCCKFRDKIGLDVALEALKTYCQRRRPQLQKVLDFARICRVEKIVRP